MASIQQSFNQMLMSAQLGAGLYSHTPAAKQKAELKQTKEALTKTLASREMQENIDDPSAAATAEYRENLALGESLTKKQFALEPTAENYRAVIAEAQGREEFEDIAAAQLWRKTETTRTQKEQLELRKKLLAGEPEVKATKKSEVKIYGE